MNSCTKASFGSVKSGETVLIQADFWEETMSKYDALKFLKATRARIPHVCDSCNQEIKEGEMYYRESTGGVNAPGIKLRAFCRRCCERESSDHKEPQPPSNEIIGGHRA